MNSTDYLWKFVQNRLMYDVRAQRWYNGMPPYGLRGFLNDKANRIMGYPILRQVRNARFTCNVPPPMNMVLRECSGLRGISNEDSRDFCANWISANDSLDGLCDFPEFRYETGTTLQTNSFVTRLGTYGPGGYVTRLAGTRTRIVARLKELQKHHWIDKRTRAVFLEFSTYNANVNLFATCRIIMEYFEGEIQLSWRFDPVKLLKVGSSLYDQLVYFCEFLFVLATVISTIRELWELKKLKCSYFSHYWNIAECFLIVFSYIEVLLYIYRYFLTSEAVSDFYRTKGNEYVRIDYAAEVDQYFHYIFSFIVFVSILKLIKLLQFNEQIKMLAKTVHLCWAELSYFFLLFAVMFCSFSWLFYFMYFRSLSDFSQISTTVLTTFKMMLGKFNVAEMTQINPLLPVLFFFFSVTNSMILINIMLSIILHAFAKVRGESAKNQYDILNFMWSSFKKNLMLQPNPVHHVKPDLSLKKKNQNFTDDEDDKLPDKASTFNTTNYIKVLYQKLTLNI